MKPGSVLLVVGLMLLPVYFVLFYLTFKRYADDGRRYVEEFGKSKWRNMITLALVVPAFVISTKVVAVSFMATAIIWIGYETALQHRRMQKLGFGNGFRARLARISILSPIALICLFASKLWFQELLIG